MYKTFFFLFLSLCTVTKLTAQWSKYHFSATKMGSPFNIVMVCDDSAKAASLAKKSFERVDSLNHIFSDYDSSSELSHLNAGAGKGPQQISSTLWKIMIESENAFETSGGAFDITVGPLSRIWRKARKEKSFPEKEQIELGLQKTGFQNIKMDSLRQTIALQKTGMLLDLGGIAKGFAAQEVVDFLSKNGISQSLADAGGDMSMSNAPPETKGWTVGVNIPEAAEDLLPRRLLLQNMAVATSGDAFQYTEHNGKKYSHIIDPRTGYGISSQRNVTIIAKNGTIADWLATACSILPIKSAKKLAQKMQAELLITELVEDKIIYHATKGFATYWKPGTP